MTWIHPACHRAKAKAQKSILLWNLSFKTIKKTKVVKSVVWWGGGGGGGVTTNMKETVFGKKLS